jgi:hypothetical protein
LTDFYVKSGTFDYDSGKVIAYYKDKVSQKWSTPGVAKISPDFFNADLMDWFGMRAFGVSKRPLNDYYQ